MKWVKSPMKLYYSPPGRVGKIEISSEDLNVKSPFQNAEVKQQRLFLKHRLNVSMPVKE
jgi:hypothetical protein